MFFKKVSLFWPAEQRQFKWSLNWGLSKETEKSVEQGSSGSVWKLNKDKFQGVSAERWKELSKTQSRNVYKLIFKEEWEGNEQDINGNQSAKGAIGLVKVSWGQDGGGRNLGTERAEELKGEDSSKVWLIIAKGESSIYLIPVVRSSAKWGDSGSESKMKGNQDTKEIWTKGVPSIETWSGSFDKGDGWKKGRNEQLQKSFSSGFSIWRGESFIFVGATEEGRIEGKGEGWKELLKKRMKKYGINSGSNRWEYLYQNAGGLIGKEESGGCKECKQAERYFPLDIAVIGNPSKIKNLSERYGNLIQEIEIKDNITQVIET